MGTAQDVRFIFVYHVKACHHARFMMFQYMTVIHPAPRSVVWHPGYFHRASGLQVYGVFPRLVFRGFPILFQYLEEETVQVERVVHEAGIRHFPNL